MTAAPGTIRLEDLIGSRVVAANGRTVAHVVEVRSERHANLSVALGRQQCRERGCGAGLNRGAATASCAAAA